MNPTGPNTELVKAVAAADTGSRYPVMQLIRRNPEQAAVISKLIQAAVPPRHNERGEREFPIPNVLEMRAMSSRISRDNVDAESVLSMLPDMELSMQILISAILSPKDMMTIELNFAAPEGVLPVELSSALLQLISTHFDQVYKIKTELPEILRKMLFTTGSYIAAVIPESSVDELINRHTPVTMEALSDVFTKEGRVQGLGLLGHGRKEQKEETEVKYGIALEDFAEYNYSATYDTKIPLLTAEGKVDGQHVLDGISVTDNPAILSYPRLQEKIRHDRIQNRLRKTNHLHLSLEAMKVTKLTDRELTSAIYKRGRVGLKQIERMVTQEQAIRATIGEPMLLELPSESVIPVMVPGQEKKHVGYFVILDATGNPVRGKSNHDYYSELSDRLSNTGSGSMPSQLLSRVKGLTTGFDCSNNEHLDYATRVYADMVEQDLLARLRNGVYTNGVALARNQEIYRIMLARTLSRQQTQLLFLPVELVTYFAFDYNGDGIGKSLLTSMKLLNSLRATLMFSNVMQSVRNSIGLTDVNFKLDEDDPDPQKTIERMMNEVVRARQQAFPLNTSSPADIVYQLQRAGYQFTYDGHPGLPDVKVAISERNTNYPVPDATLEENLRKRAIMATGLNPETVDTAFNGEFATSVVNNNIMLARRVMQKQDEFMPMLKDHLGKYILASQTLIDGLREQIAGHYDKIEIDPDLLKQMPGQGEYQKSMMVDYLAHVFIEGLEVTLPRPNTVTTANQLAALQSYIELLDIAIDGWINEKFFTGEIVGTMSPAAESLKVIIRSYFVRKWMADNGVMNELAEITARDDKGLITKDFAEAQKAHLEGIMQVSSTIIAAIEPIKKQMDAVLKKAGFQGDAMGGGGGFGGGSFGGGGGGGGFESPASGGGDDFGLGGGTEGGGSATGAETSADDQNPPTGDEEPVPDEDAVGTPPGGADTGATPPVA
jgi:hypothetical protein